jgi:hypothetical protein
MSAKVFLCQSGHDLSTLHSYHRTVTGARLCKRCAFDRAKARPKTRRPSATALRRANRLYREEAQALACAESFRIQTEQMKERKVA